LKLDVPCVDICAANFEKRGSEDILQLSLDPQSRDDIIDVVEGLVERKSRTLQFPVQRDLVELT
jgi:hypothetical protein